MPLIKGFRSRSVSDNIAELVKRPKPHKQAIAIALATSRKAQKAYKANRRPQPVKRSESRGAR